SSFKEPATPHLDTLSLHDALPIFTRDAAPATGAPLPAARVGYLLPWGLGAAEAVVEALQLGLRVQTMDRPFTIGGRQYPAGTALDRKSTRLNSSHVKISYAVFCLK